MTNKNIKINTSVSICEENGRTKVHLKPSQLWLFYSNFSSGRQQCCYFMLCALRSQMLHGKSAQDLFCSQVSEVFLAVSTRSHTCAPTGAHPGLKQATSIPTGASLLLSVSQLSPRELRQGASCWFRPKWILFCFAKPVYDVKTSWSQLSNTTAGSTHTQIRDVLSVCNIM